MGLVVLGGVAGQTGHLSQGGGGSSPPLLAPLWGWGRFLTAQAVSGLWKEKCLSQVRLAPSSPLILPSPIHPFPRLLGGQTPGAPSCTTSKVLSKPRTPPPALPCSPLVHAAGYHISLASMDAVCGQGQALILLAPWQSWAQSFGLGECLWNE